MILLADYLEAAAAMSWCWGRMDCCFFAGDWIVRRTGRDPLGPYRGRYGDRRGAWRLIQARGGLLAMVTAEMEHCRFKATSSPEDGDIAVMPIASDDVRAVAQGSVLIRSGPWWIGRTLDGLAGLDVRPQAVWSLA